MIRRAILLASLLGLTACTSDQPLNIRYQISDSVAQACPATSCSDIPMQCDSVLQIRVVDPENPETAYVSQCVAVNDPANLCAIARTNLPAGLSIPAERVEVQVAVYPRTEIAVVDGKLQCPATLRFAADNTPIPGVTSPAVAGRAFFEPGDTSTVVQLGCTDLTLVNGAACRGADQIVVKAVVDDFDTGVSASSGLADHLGVAVGEPTAGSATGADAEYQLDQVDTRVLPRTVVEPVPAWGAAIDLAFVDATCLQVLEDNVAAATATLTCERARAVSTLNLRGIRLAKASLGQLVAAAGLTAVPDKGLVIGIVLDANGTPVANLHVVPSVPLGAPAATVQYVNAGRTSVAEQTATSTNGIFVSPDAVFGTEWQTDTLTRPQIGLGGLVRGKVSIVVIRFNGPISN